MFYKFSLLFKFLEIHLYFSILILPSTALKRRDFRDNFEFKGKIVAKGVGKNSYKKSFLK